MLFHQGKPAQAFNCALNIGEIIASEEIIREWHEVLSRKKFERYLSEEDREFFLQALIREVNLIDIHTNIQICRDPKDDKYLQTAISGQADFIVTGDDDLLVLHLFQEIEILKPHDFMERINHL